MYTSTTRSMIATLLGGAMSLALTSNAFADTLLTNGKIFTANRAAPGAEAVGIRDDKIVAVGSRKEVEAALAAGFDTIDLGGKMLLPGLVDSHVHAAFAGYTTLAAELPPEVTSVDGLAAFAHEAMTSGRGMIGDTLRVGALPSAFWEDTAALDKVFNAPPFAAVPLILAGGDAHTGWANKPMLERAGVTKDFLAGLSEEARVYYGITEGGEPNGFTADHGWDKVMGAVPPLADSVLNASADAGVKALNSVGVTAFLDPIANLRPAAPVFDYHPTTEDNGVFAAYKALSEQGKLTAHVTGLVLLHAESGPEDLAVYDAVKARFEGVKDLIVGGVKILADGVIEFPAQTASLSKPYSNLGTPGPDVIGTDKFKQLVIDLDKRGGMLHVHAIGDLATTRALDAIEAARKANGNSGIPHTITHLEIVNQADYPRFAKLGVIASMQLLWAGADDYTVDLIKPYLDKSLYQNVYPAKSLLDAGAVVAGASDWPVSSPSPFLAMMVAMNRMGAKGALFPNEALSIEDLLYAYTTGAAAAVRRGGEIGSIEVGKSADFVLVDRDLLGATAEQVGETKVLWTMFEGKKVYEATN